MKYNFYLISKKNYYCKIIIFQMNVFSYLKYMYIAKLITDKFALHFNKYIYIYIYIYKKYDYDENLNMNIYTSTIMIKIKNVNIYNNNNNNIFYL